MAQQSGIKDQLFSKTVTGLVIALAVAGAIAAALMAFRSLDKVKERSIQPLSPASEKPAIRGVTALGRLEPDGEVIRLSAPSSIQGARVAQLLIAQGDLVRANQVVAVLDNRDRLQAAVEHAQKQVKVAQANLAVVRAGAKPGAISAQQATLKRIQAELLGEKNAQQAAVDRLEAQLAQAQQAQDAIVRKLQAELSTAQTDYERYQQLAQNGVISASNLDSRRLKVQMATEQLSEAQANRNQTVATLGKQLEEAKVNRGKTLAVLDQQIKEANANLQQVKDVRPVDIQQAEAEVESAIAAVGQAQADLDLAYIRAPVAGRILKVHTLAGEAVDEKQGIAELGQTSQMVVVAEVYESDIAKVHLGQRVTISSESKAFNGELRGSVSQIGLQIGKKDILSTDPAAAVDARVVEVKIRLSPEDSKRVAGLTYSKVIVAILL